MKVVIDAGILMNTNYLPDIRGDIYLPHKVYEEVKSSIAASILHSLEGRQKIIQMDPSGKAIEKVKEVASKLGQKGLSTTDIAVLALALMLSEDDKVVLYSDDFGLRNVAHECGITSKSVTVRGGGRKFNYTFQCRACGTIFAQVVDECDVCGYTEFRRGKKRS